jgi:transcription termination factor Rho
VAPAQIFRFRLRTGDFITGKGYYKSANDKYPALVQIDTVNGEEPSDTRKRVEFERLVPIFPEERYTLETQGQKNTLASRLIDLIAPIGKGQRAMIVSQPKAGKTTLLKQIANGISVNNPDAHLIVLLIDERPEEVTDIQRSVRGEVVFSTFDEPPEHHTRVAEMVQERAMRLVETGRDVVVLMDSLTRLTRAYNLVIPPTGRTLSGGMDPGALFKPKRFFGAARNIEFGGSLTIVATALVETGSRMDDIVYEEFKGTGNMEIHLDRRLAEKRIFPAIDIYKSGTRRDDLLLSKTELEGVHMIRRLLSNSSGTDVTEQCITMLDKTLTNDAFLTKLRDWVRIMEKDGFSAGTSIQNRY